MYILGPVFDSLKIIALLPTNNNHVHSLKVRKLLMSQNIAHHPPSPLK